MITKKDFISKWSNWWCLTSEAHELNAAFSKELNDVILLENQVCNDWREVAKEKPQNKQYVIVYALGGRTLMAFYKNEVFFCYDIASEELEEIEEPTHWMPAPKTPATPSIILGEVNH